MRYVEAERLRKASAYTTGGFVHCYFKHLLDGIEKTIHQEGG